MASLAANLSLSDREAIPDALYRSILGLDSNDKTIFESAWHQDAEFIFDGTPPVQGLAAILATTFQYVGAGLDTTHMVSNVRIDLKDGADTAKMTAHALAQHYRKDEGRKPEAPRFLTGNMYWIDLIKDKSDGLWKMTKFDLRSQRTESALITLNIRRVQDKNRVTPNKSRIEKSQIQASWRPHDKDIESINRDLSSCVVDLTPEVYNLKMRLLEDADCNCSLTQNSTANEA
ncbi:hypothetical protein LCI18_008301 [Fusarium solani-melongenae]|uniref:Uncharacterized protein n=1 Tax=Fusarium solani subsp. cucurbitae TaxID=2747967 RepID=A0ACD3Z878_FUSSC|nr:hypothetical protein LCI18_008301 [Fusarium solani-melongenae]